MKQNIGTLDRIIRTIVAAIIAILFFTNIISGTVAIVLLIAATVFVLTSTIRFCPIYKLFNISTIEKEK
ncbi:MAG TPA: DUF2892 domain-containing protein [Chitinophagales bacterium]|jgi:hypothetical protein|nr:DUF2892 domain-containing protein [Chitinophagales bacterium]